MRHNSLTLRLALAAAALIAVGLAATGALLVFMFRDHIERRFDMALADHMEELVAASEIGANGAFVLTWRPTDPRFNRPGSGWYWQIASDGVVLSHSLSLVGMTLDRPVASGADRIAVLEGPIGRGLRAYVRPITLPGTDGVFVYTVAGPEDDIAADVRRFSAITAVTLAVLGLCLIAAVIVQVRFGLNPLVHLRRALTDIRTGRIHRMPETFPDEVEPVVEEVNALLDQNTLLLDRARTQAGNLAHALKHPMTVMALEARHVEGERGQIMAEQLTAMRNAIDRHLSRARVAGLSGAVGARTPVGEVVDGLRISMERLHAERKLVIESLPCNGLLFAGTAEDLEEMLGNLMDNACKWATRRVRVGGEAQQDRLRMTVEDDGPGIAESHRHLVLARGRRLDESVSGAGLGLDIVRDIAEMYRGSLVLDESPLGGLRAVLDLPAPLAG